MNKSTERNLTDETMADLIRDILSEEFIAIFSLTKQNSFEMKFLDGKKFLVTVQSF